MFHILPDELKALIRDFLDEDYSNYEISEYDIIEEACEFECKNSTPMCTDACRFYYQLQNYMDVCENEMIDWFQDSDYSEENYK